MLVVLVGHSYVRYLEWLPGWEDSVTLDNGEEVKLEFEFLSPGKDYQYFLDNPWVLDAISNLNPEVVVTILGGNSIVNTVTNSEINNRASAFYTRLNQVVGPNCLKLAVQIEPRFCSAGNSSGIPEPVEFNQRRQVLNNYLNKTLKKQKLIDNVILLGAANYLNHPKYFEDGVHLKQEGLIRYRMAIMGGIRYALSHRK